MLTNPQVQLLRGRYEAEQAGFADLARQVHSLLVAFLDGQGLKYMVTHRAKSPASLERKLSSAECRAKHQMDDFEASLSPPLKDLAATRVLLYEADRVKPVVQGLVDHLKAEEHQVVEVKQYEKPNGYRASHIYTKLKGDGRVCEIQACTIGAHLWNELEHDIVYKQPGGSPDDGQRELLASLHQELALTEATVRRLIRRTTEQIAKKAQAILGAEDLRLYLEGRANGHVRGDHQDLYDLLDQFVEPLDPATLDKMFEAAMPQARALEIRDKVDNIGALKEIGIVAVQLVHHLNAHQLASLVNDTPKAPPLWLFAVKVLKELGEL